MGYITAENISIVLFFIGFFGLAARRNIIKTILSLGIMEAAVILYFLTVNNAGDTIPPIAEQGDLIRYADPVPQALMITAIVIGISITALSLIMFIELYHHFGTTNWLKAKKLRKERDK